jgi:cell division transport system permease protein
VKLNELRYIIDESALMLERRRGANILSIVIMGLSLLILVVFILVTMNIDGVIEKAGEELRVFVYLEEGISKEDSRDIQFRLLGMKGVEEVVFVSREEAMSDFRQSLGDGAGFLDDLADNPLPESYRVKLKPGYMKSRFIAKMVEAVDGWEGVEEIRYGERWLERGERLVRGFYFIDLGLGLIIFLSVIFVISNTVRLNILHRRRTINVMKLVGATNTYIQVPFILEGALQGTVASLLAVGLLKVIYMVSTRYLPDLAFLRVRAIIGFVIFCAALGATGSYVAMRRFLKL